MQATGLRNFADALVFVHGPHAAGEAARQAIICEKSGDTETAAYWRKLQRQLSSTMDTQDLPRCA